jgi:hypothetical protein
MLGRHVPRRDMTRAAGSAPVDQGQLDMRRRRLLGGMLGAYASSLVPWALAQPVADADRGAFQALSAILCGRSALDAALGARLYDALTADDREFTHKASALLHDIEQRKLDPLQLQATLDAEKSPLAAVPRAIVTAWYMGIVGEGEHARVLAYEDAVNAEVVADVLKPPTYCYGRYGSWTRKPASQS